MADYTQLPDSNGAAAVERHDTGAEDLDDTAEEEEVAPLIPDGDSHQPATLNSEALGTRLSLPLLKDQMHGGNFQAYGTHRVLGCSPSG